VSGPITFTITQTAKGRVTISAAANGTSASDQIDVQ